MVSPSIRRALTPLVDAGIPRVFTQALSTLVTLALLVFTIVTVAPATPAKADEGLSLRIDTPASVAVTPGQSLSVNFTVTNNTDKAVDVGEIVVTSQLAVLDSLAQVDDWLAAVDGLTQPGRVLAFVRVPELAAGASTTIPATLDVSSLVYGSSWGPRGLAADYKVDNDSVATARTAFIWNVGEAPAPTKLAIIAPVITPASDTAVIAADELETLTGPGGLLSKQLEFVSTHPVSIAVDPRIQASIVALGDQAPASAQEWLKKLTSLTQESFSLAFADADVAGQAQTGAGFVIPSTMNAADSSTTATPSPTPSASTTPSPQAWSPVITGLAWPAANSVVSSDLPLLAASGYSQLILSSANVKTAGNPAAVTTPTGNALVTSDSLSSSLIRAGAATSDADFASAVAASSVFLAAGALDSTTGGAVLAGLDRHVTLTQNYTRYSQALSSLTSLPWVTSTSLAATITSPVTSATIVDQPEAAERLNALSAVMARYAELATFSTITPDPTAFLLPYGQSANAVLSVGWMGEKGWSVAVGEYLHDSYDTLKSVAVVSSSTVNMVGGQANIPISVQNNLTVPVTVVVRAVPTNARLSVAADETITIQPESQGKARIPVKARVGNGSVSINVSLLTESGQPLGAATTIPINVRADWEVWGLGALGLLFVALITAGIIRTIRRRKNVAPAQESDHGA